MIFVRDLPLSPPEADFVPKARCRQCREDVPWDDTVSIRGYTVCNDCKSDYVLSQFYEEFLEENKADFLRWYLKGMEDQELIEFARHGYQKDKENEQFYCQEHEYWRDFVKECED